MKSFELPYRIINCGDGSACAEFHATLEDAEKAESEEYEPWAEDSATTLRLYLDEKGLYYEDSNWDSKLKKHVKFKVYLPAKDE